jgi:hypothetical protein
MSDEQTAGAKTGVEGTGEAGSGTGDSKAGAQAQENGGEQSLLSQALGAREGTGDKAGELKGGEAKDGTPKEGEPKEGEPKEPKESGDYKPMTEADFADVIPEGKTWDKEAGGVFLNYVEEAKIPPEVAKKLITLYSEQQDKMFAAEQAAQTATQEALANEEAEWEKASKADPEFGGQKWDASQAVITRGMQHLATPEYVALMNRQGLGNHPEVLRIWYRVGQTVGEDGGLAAGGANTALKSDEEVFYGTK